jgi:hypothetical protein
VTQNQVEAWQDTLNLVENVLKSELLVPFWRFPGKGINIKKALESDTNLDLILMITGPAWVDHLENGPTVDFAAWQSAVEDQFGPLGFLGTMIWFN